MMHPTRRRLAQIVLTVLVLFAQIAVAPGHGQPCLSSPGGDRPPGGCTAAAASTSLQVTVTGGPAPVETLQLGILTVVRALMPDTRTARLVLAATVPPLADLPVGARLGVQATINIMPPGGPPSVRIIPVTLANVFLPWSDAEVLLVSNSPETLPFGKVLFSGGLGPGRTLRLLYHHQNGSATRHMLISVTLSNPARSPILLWVSGAQSGAGVDELTVGHAAARAFLEQYWDHAGFLVQVPANTTLPLFAHDLAPLAIDSGLAQVQLLRGPRLNLQVVARLDGEADPPPDSFASDFDKTHQRGAFTRPQITRSLTYTAGGPPVAVDLGADDDLLRGEESAQRLQGNYGVMYTFQVQAENPTTVPDQVALVMHAIGGQARGTFLVGDRVIDGPTVQPNAPQILSRVRLAPGTRRMLRVATMPESGSNYPVRLTFQRP